MRWSSQSSRYRRSLRRRPLQLKIWLLLTTRYRRRWVRSLRSPHRLGASVEESSAATEELSSQVEEVVASSSALGDMAGILTSAVARFKLPDDDSDKLAA